MYQYVFWCMARVFPLFEAIVPHLWNSGMLMQCFVHVSKLYSTLTLMNFNVAYLQAMISVQRSVSPIKTFGQTDHRISMLTVPGVGTAILRTPTHWNCVCRENVRYVTHTQESSQYSGVCQVGDFCLCHWEGSKAKCPSTDFFENV